MTRNKPRIHWVSPLPPAETDIAHYTRRILPELSAATDLTLWTDARSWDGGLRKFCDVRRYSPETLTPRTMRGAPSDRPATVFVQMGNSWVFHSHILALCLRMPTVLVLHDVALQEMYLDAMWNGLLDEDTYFTTMAEWYGPAAIDAARKTLAGQHERLELAKRFPGFELAMRNATAVVTHTPVATELVTKRRTLPVYKLDLPFRAADTWTSQRREAGPLRFVQFGYTGPNRRLETVLEALAEMGPDFDFRFDVYGPLWDADYVRARAAALGLGPRIALHGYVPEPELDTAIANAHLVFNLRNPTMGEASGSQLRIWSAGTAAVVTNHGWYGSLPDNTVFKISPENERGELVGLLQKLQANRHLGAERGAAGRALLSDRFAPQRYVDALLQVAAAQERDTRDWCITQSARRTLARMNATTRSVAGPRFADQIDNIATR